MQPFKRSVFLNMNPISQYFLKNYICPDFVSPSIPSIPLSILLTLFLIIPEYCIRTVCNWQRATAADYLEEKIAIIKNWGETEAAMVVRRASRVLGGTKRRRITSASVGERWIGGKGWAGEGARRAGRWPTAHRKSK